MSLYLPRPVAPTSAVYYHLPYHNTKCSHNDNVCWAAVTQFHAGRRQGARDVTKCSVKTCSSSLQHAAGPKVSPRGSAAGSRGPSPANKETKSGPAKIVYFIYRSLWSFAAGSSIPYFWKQQRGGTSIMIWNSQLLLLFCPFIFGSVYLSSTKIPGISMWKIIICKIQYYGINER